MPKFEDLPYLKEKIASIADETEVMKRKGRTPNLVKLPQEEKLEPSESYDELLSDDLLDDILGEDDLMSSVAKEKERSRNLEEAMEQSEQKVVKPEGDFLDNLETFFEDNESDNITEISVDDSEPQSGEFDFLSSLDDLPTNDTQSEDDSLFVDNENQNVADEMTFDAEDVSDIFNEETPEENIISSLEDVADEEVTDFSDLQPQEEDVVATQDTTEADIIDLGDMSIDTLDGNSNDLDSLIIEDIPEISMMNNDQFSSDDFNIDSLLSADSLSDFDNLDMPIQEESEPTVTASDDIDLLGGLEDISLDSLEGEPAVLSESDEIETLPSLDELDNVNPSQDDIDALLGDSSLDELDDISAVSDSADSNQIPDLPSLSIDGDDGEIDLSNMLSDFSIDNDDDDSSLDLSSLDDLNISDDKSSEDSLPGLDGFDFSGMDSLSDLPSDEIESTTSSAASSFVSEEDENYDEPASEEYSDTSGDKIELSPEERKKVIIRISTFPKEAEVKIAKAIVNSKYSEEKVYPLVKLLAEHGKQEAIIAQYEKLTGDKSLHNVVLVRMTGEEYERKQKSFLSMIERNVLPILARTAALIVMVAVLVMFYVTILYPTYTASKYYKLGKKNIDENKYEYAEQNFNKAYQVQPRYREIIAYARKFRDHERYFAAERKYQMAAEQRDDRILDFEYGEFLRDIEKYEKSLSMFNYWVDKKRDDLDARNGRGETYLKWAEIEPSKLEDAENEFLNILDYKLDHADAINNLLATYIKMDNRKKVLDTYHWAGAYLKKQDYKTQIKTAGYLIDSGDLNEARRILTNISESVPKKPPYPEYDYQLARYNKALLVRPDERKNLENALAKSQMLSGADIKQIFGSEKAFNKFQANVYNDLGENYYETSRTDIRAFKMFDRAAVLNPDFGKAFYNLGNFAYLTKADREEALRYYTDAESKGFSNDIMTYNMGWLYYKKGDFDKAHGKIDKLLKKNPDVDSLKFMKGTILLNMSQYDLAYSELLEVHDKFNTFRQGNGPLDLDLKEHQNAVKMLYQSSNNLGAALYGKYRKTKKHQYFADSLRYFTEAVKYFDIMDPVGVPRTHSGGTSEKAVPYLNLKMSLYPDVFGKTQNALIDDDFNQYEYFY